MEDLKQMWQQYDEKLQRTQAFSEQMLRRLATRNTANKIEKMRNMEYFGLILLGIITLLFITRINALGNRWEVKVSFALVVLQLLGWAAWTIRKISFLGKLDAGELPVTEMLSRMSRLRLMLMRERLWGGIAGLLFLLTPAVIVVNYWMNGSAGLLDNWQVLALRIIPALALGLVAGLWAYRKLYLRPIDDITQNLKEIEEFSRD